MDIYLKKIELNGFKSFPEKTVIKFHQGITAIIGPNGCGKSNIVDALLWVLGEQRIKNLRGENNEDLIFNGSISKKPLGMTQVEANFIYHKEEVYIARRFYRHGESKYVLNDKYCRNKDIQDTLFTLRLGERKYFIFEQGSIDKLTALKPEEKRMLIEEAADISQYLERKRETTSKLIIAGQNLANIDILLADKKSRLKELKGQVVYVERYRKTKLDRMEYLKAMLAKRYQVYFLDFSQCNQNLEKIIEQENLVIQNISLLERDILGLEKERWTDDRQLKEKQKGYYDINRDLMAAKNEIEKCQQQRDFKKQKSVEINNNSLASKKEIVLIEKQINDLEEEFEKMQRDATTEESGFKEIRKKSDEMRNKNLILIERSNKLKKDIFVLQGELTQVGNRIKEVEKKKNQVENDILTKDHFIKELQNQIKNDEIEKLANDLENLKKQLAKKADSLVKSEKHYHEVISVVNDLKININGLIQEKKNLSLQRFKYEEMKKKMMGKEGESDVALLQEMIEAEKKQLKTLENFYFDEMGAAVVLDLNEVEVLSGTKFLLPIDREGKWPDSISQEEGFVSWIKDLYSIKDPKIKARLRNGILVDSLSNAIKIFFKYRIDVVTLSGELINTNGLLIKNRERGILDIIAELREIDLLIMQLEKKQRDFEFELEKRSKESGLSAERLNKEKEAHQSLEKNLLFSRSKLELLKKNQQANLERIKINESEIDWLKKDEEQLDQELKKLNDGRADLDFKLKELSASHEKNLEEEKNLIEELNQKEKDILKKENQIHLLGEKNSILAKQIKSQEESQQRLNLNIKKSQETMALLVDEMKSLEDQILQHEDKVSHLQKMKDQSFALITDLEKKITQQDNQLKQKNEQLNQRRKSLDEVKKERNRLEINASSLKKDIFQLEEIASKEMNCQVEKIQADKEIIALDYSIIEEKLKEWDVKIDRMRDSNKLNFSAETEYSIVQKDFQFLENQRQDIIKSIGDMNAAIERIDKESKKSFFDAFTKVQDNFRKNFTILFEGGEAELILTESEEKVLEGGLEIKAQPPGKRLQNLRLLSGGEKTLTSLAFLFALFEYKPAPFCVFDEVDASLDEANIQKFLKFLHKLKSNTQFIIITHNFKTMEEADYLYGISMEEPGISTIYSLQMTGKDRFQRQDMQD